MPRPVYRRGPTLPIGTRIVTKYGYVTLKLPDHPRSDSRGRVFEHVAIASRALGRPLPITAPVHHVDRDGRNNARENLVVCENQAYHRLLHIRQDAFDACGDPNARKCAHCHAYDTIGAMIVNNASGRNQTQYCHRACRIAKNRRQHANRRAR